MKSRKHYFGLVLSCALPLFLGTAASAEFDLDDFEPTKHQSHYNSLPEVQHSNAELHTKTQFQAFLNAAEEVVTRYDLNDLIGVGLVHRHFNLAENQVMVENYEVVDNVPSLVTQGYSFENAKDMKALPSSWIFSGTTDEVSLFETSTDPAVLRAKSALQQSPQFFKEMGNLIKQYKLENLISLSVLRRDSLSAQIDQIYAEDSPADQKRSIIQLLTVTDNLPNSIRTSWSFKGPKQTTCAPCPDRRCVTACGF